MAATGMRLWMFDWFANNLTPIDEFNKIINKLIKDEKRKATEILDKLNSEEKLRKKNSDCSVYFFAPKTRRLFMIVK